MLEDTRLRVFDAVVRMGSFTQAARELGISQSAVSQNIAELERLTGCELLVRARGSVTLTEKGRLFHSYARNILYWYDVMDAVVVRGDRPAPQPLRLELGDRAAELSSLDGQITIKLL